MATEPSTKKALDPLARGARRFENKVCVVAGAGQGIGLATVRRLATEGATVVIGDWAEDIARKAEQEVLDFGEQAAAHIGDYRSWEGCQSLIDFSVQRFGRIDSLIVIVGGTIWSAPYEYNTPEQIVETVNKNLWPTMWCTRAVLPTMIEQHKKAPDGVGGNIVTLATHALVGLNRVPYAASKGGLIGLTTALSKEVGRHGIRVNCVAPSLNTGKEQVYRRDYRLEHVARPEVPEEARLEQPTDAEGNREERPLSLGLKRAATVQEVAAAIAFVASDDAGYISGEVISVGGGETFPF
jgi:NAD(P)-dependent dehydrogenase (short-subunit alcohol dehydrogenase family)